MVINNGLLLGEDFRFTMSDIAFENGRITAVAPAGGLPSAGAIDAEGGFVLPGFVDIHTHGCMGSDFCDADANGINNMLLYYGANGVTSVVCTTMAQSENKLAQAIKAALPFFDADGSAAVLRGINMEGPFLNKERCGAQNPEYIIPADFEMFMRLYELAQGYIRMVGVAPEVATNTDFIRKTARYCTVALAHTCADYRRAAKAFEAGASHVSHMFNAMLPFNHREPGVVGAASDAADTIEIIADGVHLHPAVVRAAFSWFGAERVCLVSDSMRGAGMPNGRYDFGGQEVELTDGVAKLVKGGVISGSATNLAECCRNVVRFGVPMEKAVRAATLNPAKAVGLDHEVGTLMPGKRADIVVWNRDMQTQEVFVGGVRILE